MLTISIIDCAIKQASHHCFNQLVDTFEHKFRYHRPSQEGMQSLNSESTPDAYIVFGSASNVGDNLPWHGQLAEFCQKKLEQHIPVLGICFGHQLIGNQFDWPVIRNPNDVNYHGSRMVKILEDSWGLKKGNQLKVFTAHSYSLKPMQDHHNFTLVGSSDECAVDIIAHKELPFLGIQGHPEASYFFVQNEIEEKSGELPTQLKEKTKKSGLSFIQLFLLNCEKLKRSL